MSPNKRKHLADIRSNASARSRNTELDIFCCGTRFRRSNRAENSNRLLRRASLRKLLKEFAAIPLEPKWAESFDNLVTTVGKNNMLDQYLAGSSYTAAWYIGLIGATSYTTGAAVGDTSASHAGWVEDVEYSQTARPTTSWSAAANGSKTLSAACVYSINGDGTTIKGCFLINISTKSGTTGTMFSAGLFTGGDKILANGDTLNVTYTATLT